MLEPDEWTEDRALAHLQRRGFYIDRSLEWQIPWADYVVTKRDREALRFIRKWFNEMRAKVESYGEMESARSLVPNPRHPSVHDSSMKEGGCD